LSEDYVQAMAMMLQQDQAQDFVIATGESCSLEDFVQMSFAELGLNFEKYLKVDQSLFRPADIRSSYLDPSKANEVLGWQAKGKVKQVIQKLFSAL